MVSVLKRWTHHFNDSAILSDDVISTRDPSSGKSSQNDPSSPKPKPMISQIIKTP